MTKKYFDERARKEDDGRPKLDMARESDQGQSVMGRIRWRTTMFLMKWPGFKSDPLFGWSTGRFGNRSIFLRQLVDRKIKFQVCWTKKQQQHTIMSYGSTTAKYDYELWINNSDIWSWAMDQQQRHMIMSYGSTTETYDLFLLLEEVSNTIFFACFSPTEGHLVASCAIWTYHALWYNTTYCHRTTRNVMPSS